MNVKRASLSGNTLLAAAGRSGRVGNVAEVDQTDPGNIRSLQGGELFFRELASVNGVRRGVNLPIPLLSGTRTTSKNWVLNLVSCAPPPGSQMAVITSVCLQMMLMLILLLQGAGGGLKANTAGFKTETLFLLHTITL